MSSGIFESALGNARAERAESPNLGRLAVEFRILGFAGKIQVGAVAGGRPGMGEFHACGLFFCRFEVP
jgi:hypothetical protein